MVAGMKGSLRNSRLYGVVMRPARGTLVLRARHGLPRDGVGHK